MSLRIKVLGVVVGVVFAAWSAFWWFAASAVERASSEAIIKAGDRGVSVACPDRTVGGWPFRMTLVCGQIGVNAKGLQIAANGLRAVAMIYNPSHLIVEADSPFEIAGNQLAGPVNAQWKSGRASLQLQGTLLEQASLAFTDLALNSEVLLPLADTKADNVEVHVRRSQQPQDLDVAITSRSVTGFLNATELPEFDLDILATLAEGTHFLVGQHKQYLDKIRAGAGAIEVRRALLTIGEARIEISGTLSLSENGHLSGQPRIAIANVRALGGELARIPGIDPARIQPFLSAFENFGEKTMIEDHPANAVTLLVRDGYVTAGLIPLGRLRPIVLD